MIVNQCRARTKQGGRCQIEARPSGLCHTHDPVVRCRVLNAKGKPCTIATGGGPCDRHRGQQQASVEAALNLIAFHEPAGADPLFAVGEHSSPPRAATAEEPVRIQLSLAFVARTINLG
ncbi:hypothetical protein Snoj_35470 [Streptomyces nojiriensis]|uniref:Uncharacterized protein n=1 Tax=Streptomyces nojiriensis TaxID=66374 RepID=A0ABQ3SNA9_9ACTN|nr:DUF5763 domain-containing protein [Streptomyces nojiriensis]QTI43186.1 hypothetical protein JYK04_00948 [Streptomyces nojiriensis]GGS31325.1 hypothetical protein GCM10010205_71950 [Streptomyces nojiriensis]GHI69629.1 hypothetical protein Snoj_35470 [Streptomyces nojiriensis]